MKSKYAPALIAVAALSCLAATARVEAAGVIDTIFIEPDSYSDIGRDQGTRDKTLKIFDAHFKTMAARLPDAQTLRLEFTDIDLAGAPDLNSVSEVRFFGGSNPPHLVFYFRLTQGTEVLQQGKAHLVDINFYRNRRPTYLGSNELPHERRMLDEWFEKAVLSR